MGYSRGSLNGIFRKLKKLDALDIVSMNVTSKVTGFDFGEFVRKNDFRLLKETRKIYWYGRKGDNQFMSESYLLYRNAKFKMLKKAALKYMLQQINKGLKKHSEEWKISGEIVAQFKDIDYMKKFDDFQEKRITPSEFCDIIFGRSERL